MQKPITEISLPTHHQAVAATKEGQCVTIVARRVKMPEPSGMMDKVDAGKEPKRPPPTLTQFHVEQITPMKGKTWAEKPARKASNPVDFVKGREKPMVEMAGEY